MNDLRYPRSKKMKNLKLTGGLRFPDVCSHPDDTPTGQRTTEQTGVSLTAGLLLALSSYVSQAERCDVDRNRKFLRLSPNALGLAITLWNVRITE